MDVENLIERNQQRKENGSTTSACEFERLFSGWIVSTWVRYVFTHAYGPLLYSFKSSKTLRYVDIQDLQFSIFKVFNSKTHWTLEIMSSKYISCQNFGDFSHIFMYSYENTVRSLYHNHLL